MASHRFRRARETGTGSKEHLVAALSTLFACEQGRLVAEYPRSTISPETFGLGHQLEPAQREDSICTGAGETGTQLQDHGVFRGGRWSVTESRGRPWHTKGKFAGLPRLNRPLPPALLANTLGRCPHTPNFPAEGRVGGPRQCWPSVTHKPSARRSCGSGYPSGGECAPPIAHRPRGSLRPGRGHRANLIEVPARLCHTAAASNPGVIKLATGGPSETAGRRWGRAGKLADRRG